MPLGNARKKSREAVVMTSSLSFSNNLKSYKNMRYYQIVRLANESPDQEEFNRVHKLVRRGWLRKAVEYLQQWNYGGENIGTALCMGDVYNTPTDDRERTDRVIYRDRDGSCLCYCNPCRNGGYEAYYLTAALVEENIFSFAS